MAATATVALATALLIALVVTVFAAIGRGATPRRERRPLLGRTTPDLIAGLAAEVVRGVRELDRTSQAVARTERATCSRH
jgi:hypothetical protein